MSGRANIILIVTTVTFAVLQMASSIWIGLTLNAASTALYNGLIFCSIVLLTILSIILIVRFRKMIKGMAVSTGEALSKLSRHMIISIVGVFTTQLVGLFFLFLYLFVNDNPFGYVTVHIILRIIEVVGVFFVQQFLFIPRLVQQASMKSSFETRSPNKSSSTPQNHSEAEMGAEPTKKQGSRIG